MARGDLFCPIKPPVFVELMQCSFPSWLAWRAATRPGAGCQSINVCAYGMKTVFNDEAKGKSLLMYDMAAMMRI
jgi:hypothetical protein